MQAQDHEGAHLHVQVRTGVARFWSENVTPPLTSLYHDT
jgi:hypothetical protein